MMSEVNATYFLQNVFKKVRKGEKVVLVVGPQNSAKSSLISLFLNKKLKAQFDEEQGEIRLMHCDEGEQPEIASIWGQACTVEPSEYKIHDDEQSIVWDCRSIFDKDVDQFPEHDIQNQYFNFLISQNFMQIKYIFCIEQSSIMNGQALHFRNQTKVFSNQFNSVTNLEGSICMCSTKNNGRNFNQNCLGPGLLAILRPFPIQQQLVRFMSSNLKLFPKVKDQTEEFTPDRNYFQELTQNLEYAEIQPNQFKFAVHDSSVELLNVLFDESHVSIFEVLEFIKQKVYEKCNEVRRENGNQNEEQILQFRIQKEKQIENPLFSQEGLDDEIINHQQEYLQLLDLADIYHLKTNLIEIKNNIYIQEDANHLKTNLIEKVNDLYVLEDGFLAISRYLKNIFVVIDKNEMDEDMIRFLNQKNEQGQEQVSFLRFFELVCDKRIDRSRMEELIDQLIFDVSKEEKKLLNSIKLIENGINYQYYENFFKFMVQQDLKNFATMELSKAIEGQRKSTAKCQYFMGCIMLQLDQLQESLDHFLNAIDFNEDHDCNEFPDIYQNIISIFLRNKELLREIDDDQTLSRLYQAFNSNLKRIMKEASDLIIDFSEEKAVGNYDHYLDYLENIHDAILILTDLEYYDDASQNQDQIVDGFNKLMDLICKKLNDNQINNEDQIQENAAQDESGFETQIVTLEKTQMFKFQMPLQKQQSQNNNEAPQSDYQNMIDYIKKSFKDNIQGQIFIDELTQQQFFVQETNSWFRYLKAASKEAYRSHKSVILNRQIDSEDYNHLSEETLDRIIKFAKLHPKNLIAKKINSTALVCRGIQNMKKGLNEKALSFFQEALNVDNGLNKAREWAADLNFQEKNYMEAKQLYFEIQFQEDVEKCFEKMIEANPMSPKIREDKAKYYLQISLFDFAKKSYNEAIKIYSGRSDYQNMVRIYQEMDKIETQRTQKSQIYHNYVLNPESIVPRTIINEEDDIDPIDVPYEIDIPFIIMPKSDPKELFITKQHSDPIEPLIVKQHPDPIEPLIVKQHPDPIEPFIVKQHPDPIEPNINNVSNPLIFDSFDSNLIVDIDLNKNLYSQLNTNEKLNLIYRASEDSFEASAFHEKCDDKGPTLTIARCKENGTVFGGFTNISWKALEIGKVVDGNGESFIFTIKNDLDFVRLQCIDQNKELWNCKSNLPSFGQMNIRLVNKCNESNKSFTEVGSCYQLPFGIEQDSDETYQFITGIEEFTIDEIEVFQVKLPNQQEDSQIPKLKNRIFEDEIENIDKPQFISQIIGDEYMKNNLIFNINGFNSESLLYRASEDSFEASAFHEKCDGKGPTLTIARCKENGTIFGGFTTISWEALEIGKVVEGNGESFIFTIKNDLDFVRLQCIDQQKELWNCKSNLPSFGQMNLRLVNKCNQSNKSFTEVGGCYQLPQGIEKDTDEAFQFITGIEDFTIDEIEVFQVKFSNQLDNIQIPRLFNRNFEEEKKNNDLPLFISKIIGDENLKNTLIQNLNGFKSGRLLYRASEDSFEASAFHEKCDDKGPTLTIAKNSENGTIFGGFTPISWKSFEKGQLIAGNGDSFVFTIQNCKDFVKLQCINQNKELWNSKDTLPSFGTMDLRLFNNCNDLDKSFSDLGNSYALPDGIEEGSQEALEYLTGQESFKVDEIEVFQVQY